MSKFPLLRQKLAMLRRRPKLWETRAAKAPACAGAQRGWVAAALLLTGCVTLPPAPANPQDAFLAAIQQHCGKAYAGRLVTSEAPDADMAGKPMVMHVRGCAPGRAEIPFHIGGIGPDGGWDRSRTWIVTRTASGLRLKHDHRHADGSKDALTLYGGDTVGQGTTEFQSFPVDAESMALFRSEGRTASLTNIWTVAIDGQRFAYELRRAGRHFRVEFDLTKPVAPPPAPWGW
jgi:hypothetical protein